MLAEAGHQFGGGELAGVQRSHHEQGGLGAGDGGVGELQDLQVVAALPLHLLPAVADVDEAGQRRVGGGEGIGSRQGLLDGAVAGVARDPGILAGQSLEAELQEPGRLPIQDGLESRRLEPVPEAAVELDRHRSRARMILPGDDAAAQEREIVGTVDDDLGHPGALSGRRSGE